jgi:hypothetical protein
MKKTRSDCAIGTLSQEQQEALFEASERRSLMETLSLCAKPASEGGLALPVAISLAALSRWLSSERLRRFGERLRKGRAAAALALAGAPGAAANAAIIAAVKEHVLDAAASGDLSAADLLRLGQLALADTRLADERARFDAQRQVLQERLKESQARRAKIEADAARAAAETKHTLASTKFTPEEKQRRLRAIFGLPERVAGASSAAANGEQDAPAGAELPT